MTGYTPLFGSLTTGTLCGRWPDIGLWPIILALADRSGIVDVTPQYIAGVTGLALPEVVACMDRFCQPDPYSRSGAEEGRRLILLAPDQRNWGWQIVNFGMYREKARLMAKSMREVESGANRERLAGPSETAAHRRSPPLTAGQRPSDNTRQDSESKIGQTPPAFDRFWSVYPKKRKRKTAEEIWNRKRLDSRAEELLADIRERSKSDRRWLEGFIPDPTTYLNGERWNDEREPTKRAELPRRLPPDAFEVARRGG